MDQAQRTQIVTAAVSAAGPLDEDGEGWINRVNEAVARITAMCSDTSPTAKVIDQIERSKTFTATVLGGSREKSSTRVVLRMQTRPSQFHPDGIEEARTERTDTPAGAAMANRLRTLIGHRVAVWVELESINDGATKVRVIRHVEDLGVGAEANRPVPIAAAS